MRQTWVHRCTTTPAAGSVHPRQLPSRLVSAVLVPSPCQPTSRALRCARPNVLEDVVALQPSQHSRPLREPRCSGPSQRAVGLTHNVLSSMRGDSGSCARTAMRSMAPTAVHGTVMSQVTRAATPQRMQSFAATPRRMNSAVQPPSLTRASHTHTSDGVAMSRSPSVLFNQVASPMRDQTRSLATQLGSESSPVSPRVYPSSETKSSPLFPQRVIAVPCHSKPPFSRSPSWTEGRTPFHPPLATVLSPTPDRAQEAQDQHAGPTSSSMTCPVALAVSNACGSLHTLAQSQSWIPPPVASMTQSEPPRSLSFVPMGEAQAGRVRTRHTGLGLQRSRSFTPSCGDASCMDTSKVWAPHHTTPGSSPRGLPFIDARNLSWEAPDDPVAPSGLRFISASASRQHPAKRSTRIVNADVVEEGITHLGICDGVSGVHALGISPDELPRELLLSCRAKLQLDAQRGEADDGTWFTGLIKAAYDDTQAYGATTLLLAALRDSNLVTANLGDCALLLLRPCCSQPLKLRPVFKTEPMRYDSRRPVQVQRLRGFKDENAHMVIQEVMVSTTPVQPGDILVVGSDGLFDNLRDQDIQLAIEKFCAPSVVTPGLSPLPALEQLRCTAEVLVDLAIASVNLMHADTGEYASANNADDTTALVAVVMASPDAGANSDEDELLEDCSGLSETRLSDSQVLRDRTNTVFQDPLQTPKPKPVLNRSCGSCHAWSAENRSPSGTADEMLRFGHRARLHSVEHGRQQYHCTVGREDCAIS